ncbi:MAG TPA: ABC transporter permease [Vicinamibacterales bacterium]|nr:ABC transporter permease [Vicinamibacterales bacterium]
MDHFIQNVRFAVRTLGANQTFAWFAILTLGLGIGANTAIFSVIDGVLLKPLPYADGERLVVLQQSSLAAGRQNPGVAIRELYDYREQTRSFDALVEYHQMNFDLLRKGNPDRVNTGVVSHDFFTVLGIRPMLGRAFIADDDRPGADAVLVLSHSYWQKAFGADPSVVGRVVQMNDRPHTIVGVLPEVPLYPQENDVYMPVSACPFRAAAEKRLAANRRVFSALTVFGKLRSGVSSVQAAGDVARAAARFVSGDPHAYLALSGFAANATPLRTELTRDARPLLLILLGTTGIVLLIACSNVANLSLARLLRRERELAVRAALGAGRRQLIAQLLTESTLLALAGGVVGLLFAGSTLSMLTTFVGRFTARTQEIAIDPRVLLFTIALSVATGVLFGILPALSSRADLVSSMKQGSKGAGESPARRRIQQALIIGQVAVAVVLLVGAGLLLTSFYRLQQVDGGYEGDHVVSAEAFPNFTKYASQASQVQFYDAAVQRMSSLPGVVAVAVTNAVPLSAITPGANPILIKGATDAASERRPTADLNVSSPLYFAALGIPMAEGRDFTVADKAGSPPVAVINQTMAKYWGGRSPLGAQVSPDNGQTWLTIVGVAGDTHQYGVGHDVVPELFTPLAQTGIGGGRFLVRTHGDPAAFASTLVENVRAVDPDMPVKNVLTMSELRDRALETPRLTAALLSVFAALALAVTLAGIGGVIAMSVSHRLREFGVRMALGATTSQILRAVLGQGLSLIAGGLLAGVLLSVATTRVLASYLYNTQPWDPTTLVLVVTVFVVTGLASCLGPAWRATNADPLETLKAE